MNENKRKRYVQSCNFHIYRDQYERLVRLSKKANVHCVEFVRAALDSMIAKTDKEIIEDLKK